MRWLRTTAFIATALIASVSPQRAAKADPVLPCRQWHRLMKDVGLPVSTFAPIMWRESRCQPGTVGWNYRPGTSARDCKWSTFEVYRRCSAVKTYDMGLLQINSSWQTLTAKVCRSKQGDITVLFDPRCNLMVARYLFTEGGGLRNWGYSSNK